MQPPLRARYLRLLGREELVLGQVLPGHLRDATGHILILRGETLTIKHLQMLDGRGLRDLYVGQDWPRTEGEDVPAAAITPAELVATLKRRIRSRDRGAQGQRHGRRPWRTRVRITVQECCQGMLRRRDIEVYTCDLSASGFAFRCQQFIHPGTIQYPRFEALPNRPTLKAIVRNCVHVSGRDHRVGAEFVKLAAGETVPPD